MYNSLFSGRSNGQPQEGGLWSSTTLFKDHSEQTTKGALQQHHLGICGLCKSWIQINPLDYSWKYKDGCYVPDWFCGPQYPDYLFGVVEELPEENAGGDASELDDGEDSGSESNWSDDSDCEDV